MNRPEHLIIRGRLDAADEFTPRRCRSSRYVRPRPSAPESDLIVETIGSEGQTLRSAPATVSSDAVCGPGIETWRVEGIVVLDEGALTVRLRRGERVVWSSVIAEKPTLRVKLRSRPKRGGPRSVREVGADYPGGRPAVLEITTSVAAEGLDSHVTLVHQWGEGLFRTVLVGAAADTLEVPADALPGGSRCRFVAIYSNGMRSAVAATDWYPFAPIGPIVRIDAPTGKERLVEGATLSLRGYVEVPEDPGGSRYPERLSWMLNGRVVGAGSQASVLRLPVGRNEITLLYDEPGGPSARRSVTVQVKASRHVHADDWEPWDHFSRLD